jgi:hypothetical protein
VGNLITLILAIAGLVLVTLGFALGDPWPVCVKQLLGWAGIGWVGIVISVVAIIRQYRETRSFTYDFSESTWKPSGDQYVLEIPRSEHNKGRTPASTTVYEPTDSGGYQEIECGVDVTSSGTVRVWIGHRTFSGRVVIK